jgi:hypothetical protein
MILTLIIITIAAIILRIIRGKTIINKNKINLHKNLYEKDKWVDQAKKLVRAEEKRSALFKRISERKDNIYYNRINWRLPREN